MKFFLIFCLGLLTLSFVQGCKARQTLPEVSAVKTDETKAALSELCEQFEPFEDATALADGLCTCMRDRRADLGDAFIAQTCSEQGLPLYMDRLRGVVLAEGREAFRDTAGSELTAADQACLASMSEFYLQMHIESLARDCEDEKVSYAEFRSQVMLPTASSPEACWVMTRMTDEACILARPCRGSGASDPLELPLSSTAKQDLRAAGIESVAETQSLILCHQHIQDIHFLKDPSQANINYNLSFANLLGFGRVQNHITYGPANCHGTASAVSGGVLDDFAVTTINYHSPTVRNECSQQAEVLFAAAKAKSPDGTVLAKHLPVERGGYLINMDHNETCSESECGEISFSITSCDQPGLIANIFFSGMCIHCWSKTLATQGFEPLPDAATWKDLVPGCVLTANDHSIAFLNESNGMCYYYESTSPYGPPQLRVDTCNQLYSRFGKRWCPRVPLAFDVKLSAVAEDL